MQKELVYLAGPYTHPHAEVVHDRYKKHLKAYTHLLQLGYAVIAPIVQGHQGWLESRALQSWTHDQWLELDFSYLKACTKCVILTIEGWDKSKGVALEIAFCIDHKIPIVYLDFETGEITSDARG